MSKKATFSWSTKLSFKKLIQQTLIFHPSTPAGWILPNQPLKITHRKGRKFNKPPWTQLKIADVIKSRASKQSASWAFFSLATRGGGGKFKASRVVVLLKSRDGNCRAAAAAQEVAKKDDAWIYEIKRGGNLAPRCVCVCGWVGGCVVSLVLQCLGFARFTSSNSKKITHSDR